MGSHKSGTICGESSDYRCDLCNDERYIKQGDVFPLCKGFKKTCEESKWVNIIEKSDVEDTQDDDRKIYTNTEITSKRDDTAIEIGKKLIFVIVGIIGIIFIAICLDNIFSSTIENNFLNDIAKCIFNLFTTIVGFVLGFFYQNKEHQPKVKP